MKASEKCPKCQTGNLYIIVVGHIENHTNIVEKQHYVCNLCDYDKLT